MSTKKKKITSANKKHVRRHIVVTPTDFLAKKTVHTATARSSQKSRKLNTTAAVPASHSVIENRTLIETFRKNEERFRAFLTASSDVIYRMSANWDEMQQLDGREYMKNTHKPTKTWLHTYIHKDDHRIVVTAIKKAIKNKSIFELEHRVKHIDGSLGWTHSRAVPIFNDAGVIVEWFGAATDVTARKNKEDARNGSEIRYRRLFETAKDGIIILDEKTALIADVNPYLCNLLGYTREDLLNKELWQLGFFKNKEESKIVMQQLKKKKFIRYEDLPLQTKEGGKIEVEFISNVYDEGNSVVIQCNIRDITERKKNERELLESKALTQTSKEKLRALFMNAPAIIAIVSGPELKYEMANKKYLQLISAKGPIEGIPLRTVIPNIEPKIIAIINNVATKGERFATHEIPVLLDWDNNNKPYTKYLDLTFEPLFDSDKKPDGLMFFGYDISEQVENRQKLEETARTKEEFLSMASHEMRTPVTSIKGYAQVLESRFKNNGDTSSARLISKLDGQVDHLTQLIGDLFDDTKIKEGKLELRPAFFDFNALVRDAIEEVQHVYSEHKISSRLDDIPKVNGDKQRLRQVIVNLLTNALKYSPTAVSVTVETVLKTKHIKLIVRDFGIGISKEHQSKIFTRFYRVRSRDLDTYPGLGLGLYITADIVKRHGGTIEVESTLGKGSTFIVTLPIKHITP